MLGSANSIPAMAALALLATAARAQPAGEAAASAILEANHQAMGGDGWNAKSTLRVEFAYSGQGLTGTTSSLEDLRRGRFVDAYAIGPTAGANGFDGAKAWEQEPSGTVTNQAGGDVIPLAISEAYLDQNLWWNPDRGGARIAGDGVKSDGEGRFDVLTVTPKGGAAMEAWFDAKTHLLSRMIQAQGTLTITTFYSDYRPVEGVQIAGKQVVDDGSGAAHLQTSTLTRATFRAALPAAAYARPPERLSDYSIAGGAASTTVPFQLVNNHIYAEASVNGAKPALFIFDTGGHDILTPQTAKAIGVKSQGAQTAAGAGDAVAFSGVAMADTIKVGDATLTHQPIAVLQFSAPGVEGVTEAGMIGYEFFARFITRFDYGRRTITFIDKRRFDPRDAGVAVPMRLYHQFPEVLGSYDGLAGRFGIDTGSRMTLMLTGPFVRQNHLRASETRGVEAMTGWGVGGPSRSFVTRGGVLKLGDVTIDGPLTALSSDKGGAGAAEAFPNNIGGGILKRFVVTLDYDHGLIYLKPVDGSVADLDRFDRSGMWINAADDGFVVVDITKGAPAEAAGLQVGDHILAVDGKPASDIALSDLRQSLRLEPAGAVVTFRVKRGADATDMRLRLRDLI